MKRSGYIQRKTGLTRKTRIKPMSDKRKKRHAETQPERNERAASRPCDLCGNPWRYRVEHEIARGPDRDKALDQPYAKLVLCHHECHLGVIHGGVGRLGWPIEKQLALKQARAPEEYDLQKFNELTGRNIEQADVDKFNRELPL